ncbi:MAG: SDR family oxidoreductase [bacterium]|nr:SDR family oxidoreductase [bacterium]
MLEGKTVFVTGGTGYIGAEICRKFSSYGARVIFSYNNNSEKAEELLGQLENGKAIQMDLTRVPDINAKVGELFKEGELIDILVNNASISQVMPLPMLEEEDVDLVMNVNLKGTIFVTRAVIKGMIRKRKGVIVNMGSIAGHRLLDVPITYAMTKAAMSGFTFSLAVEMKKFNIRVNNIVPGMLEGGVALKVPDDEREDYISHCAAARPGTAEEVAETVCFVASDRASYINGQNIHVDGGI